MHCQYLPGRYRQQLQLGQTERPPQQQCMQVHPLLQQGLLLPLLLLLVVQVMMVTALLLLPLQEAFCSTHTWHKLKQHCATTGCTRCCTMHHSTSSNRQMCCRVALRLGPVLHRGLQPLQQLQQLPRVSFQLACIVKGLCCPYSQCQGHLGQ